jgi:hypothetical protein
MDALPRILATRDQGLIKEYILSNSRDLLSSKDPCVADGGLAHVRVAAQAYPALQMIGGHGHIEDFRGAFVAKDRAGKTAMDMAREMYPEDTILRLLLVGRGVGQRQ